MEFCKKCVMPNTRPGITFNSEGVCIACEHYENKKSINYDKRFIEFTNLCNKYRRKSAKEYDCIIAVSGGKDSHYQVYIMKELMNMNPLLVTVEDFYTMTKAGKHNIKNISDAFSCNVFSFKPNRYAGKIITRIMFEKFGRPLWYVDRLIYTIPLICAVNFNIPLVVYGENVSYEYGGKDDKETYSAKDQINNGVAPDFDYNLFANYNLSIEDLIYLDAPSKEKLDKIEPIYLSYFFDWNSYRNYEIAKTRGFKCLEHEWDRSNHVENFNQIDSIGYLINAWMKFPKYGHAYATDYASRWVRYGILTREEAVKIVEERDHALDSEIVEDFCRFADYSLREFWSIIEKHYNKELFFKNKLSQYRLKDEYMEKRRNS